MSSERRTDERLPMRARMDYRDTTGGNFLYEYTSNISNGGIFIETTDPLPVGTEVEMRFQPPGMDEVLEIAGTVVWVNPYRDASDENPNPGMGIQFGALSDEAKDLVANLVKAIAYL
jgi:type IV pilus assembly protein PilZ